MPFWSDASLSDPDVHICCKVLFRYDSVCCLLYANPKQISNPHKLLFRGKNSSTLHLPTEQGNCYHLLMPSPHCDPWHLPPITHCLGSSTLLPWRPVNIPNVFCTDESAAQREGKGHSSRKNGQRHNIEGCKRELVGELKSRDGLPWLKGHPAGRYCSISQWYYRELQKVTIHNCLVGQMLSWSAMLRCYILILKKYIFLNADLVIQGELLLLWL